MKANILFCMNKILKFSINKSAERKLKILFYSHNFNFEGAPNVLYEIAIALQKKGKYNISVVSPSDGHARNSLEQQGIKTIVLNEDDPMHFKMEYGDNEGFILLKPKIIEMLTDEVPDVVFVNVLHNYHVINILNKLEIPSVWMIHESFDEIRQVQLIMNNSHNYYSAFQQAKTVVFCTRYSQQYYEPFNIKNNFRIIHNALNQRFSNLKLNEALKNKARNKLGIQPDELVILNVGIIAEHKNQELIVRAAHLLTGKKIRYILVGARKCIPYFENISNLVNELELQSEVTVVPETNDVDSYYCASDIFVFTSTNDTYPLVILEAMAYGLPIIATPINGVNEQVKFGFNALKADYTSPKKLADQINFLAENEKIRKEMGKNSRKVFKKLETFKDFIKAHELVILDAFSKTSLDLEN